MTVLSLVLLALLTAPRTKPPHHPTRSPTVTVTQRSTPTPTSTPTATILPTAAQAQTDFTAPVVVMTLNQPGDGAVFTAPRFVNVQAYAQATHAVTRVEYRDNGALFGTVSTPMYDVTSAAWQITAATAQGKHVLNITAFDGAGNTASTDANPKIVYVWFDSQPPTTPTNLTAAFSNCAVDLAWTGSTDSGTSGLQGYRVLRDGVLLNLTAQISYRDTGLPVVGTTHSYAVQAMDNAGNVSGPSNAATVEVP